MTTHTNRRRVRVKPWVCRLRARGDSRIYVRVQVWPTKRDFLAHINEAPYTTGPFGRRVQGTCTRYQVVSCRNGRARRSPCCAVVNLWRGQCTIEVVTHELLHATFAWGYRTGFDFSALSTDLGVMPPEERLTYAHSTLVRDFWRAAQRRGGPFARDPRIRVY